MSTAPSTPRLSETEFESLARIIHERSGIRFELDRRYVLESKLADRLRELGMDSFGQYVSLLSMGPYQQEEFQEMFNRITMNETSFFRHEAQLEVFERVVLPEMLAARKATKRLRIWSAACASGEEPYTLAMIVHRTLGVRLADWHIEILGTDISEHCLEIASRGVYDEETLGATPDGVKRQYFARKGSQWAVGDEVRQMVGFEAHNLEDGIGASCHGIWDIIFCRNVMIYFDEAMKQRVLHTLHEQLDEDGTLFLGHAEAIRPEDVPFEARSEQGGFCYRKA